MKNRFTKAILIAGALMMAVLGTAGKIDKIQGYERDHYQALKVFFKDEKKETRMWLKNKTPAERDQWLKDMGYWDYFYKYDEETRKEILGREPKEGWKQDMLYMAWGPPFRKQKSTKRTASDTIILSYRMEVDKKGRHLVWTPKSKESYKAIEQYTTDITLDDHVITKIVRRDGWSR